MSQPTGAATAQAGGVDWQAKRQQAQEAARATKDWAVEHGKEAKDWAVTHGKEAGAYISTQGREVAGRAVEVGRETKEQVVSEWNTSLGLGAVCYNALVPHFWPLPVISFWCTVAVLAAAVAVLVSCESAGPALILMLLAVTLFNQIIHNFCDAALMLQMQAAKDSGVGRAPTLRETWPMLKGVWEPVLGLSVAAWAESVAAFGMAVIRGLVYVFQLPFRLCLQPFTVDRPVAAVDPSLQLALALAMAVVEKTPARAAVDNAEAYLVTQVGEKPHYKKTLWGILSVTALPMLVAGIVLSGFSFIAAGFSLIFVATALSQFAWNLCSHLLGFSSHRLTTTGKDDILSPAGVAGNAYAPTDLPEPPAAAAAPAPPAGALGAESKEDASGYSTLEV